MLTQHLQQSFKVGSDWLRCRCCCSSSAVKAKAGRSFASRYLFRFGFGLLRREFCECLSYLRNSKTVPLKTKFCRGVTTAFRPFRHSTDDVINCRTFSSKYVNVPSVYLIVHKAIPVRLPGKTHVLSGQSGTTSAVFGGKKRVV